MDTARVALAPKRALLGVASSRSSTRSISRTVRLGIFSSAGEMTSAMFRTALSTPLPPYLRWSPSRSSTASNLPVEAPEGAAAVPMVPSESCTVALTVGFPRESRISQPYTFWIFTM